MFCTKCGTKNEDTSKFCKNCGNQLNMPNDANSNAGTSPSGNTTPHYTVYEKFSPAMGLGISFAITDRSIVISNAEYLYSTMDRITLINPPSALTNGVANTQSNGKRLTLAFKAADAQRFMKMLEYANNQIDKAHGTECKYRYIIQDSLTAKVEVYDEFIIAYVMRSGLRSVVGNVMAGGAGGSIVYFSDLVVLIDNSLKCIRFIINDAPLDIALTDDNYRTACDIVDFINQAKNSPQQSDDTKDFTEEKWEPIIGQNKRFHILDQVLTVPVEMDLFNSYRLKFRVLAADCADRVKEETNRTVSNLMTYVEVFPKKYDKYLDVMIKKAVDILVSEEVWTVTQDSFAETHKATYHLVQDDLNVTLQSIGLTSQNNQKAASSLTGLVPNLVGGGFGLAGAVKGIATAAAFNIVRDTAANRLVNQASQVRQEQQIKLFNRINFDVLFQHVFLDYYCVAYTLANLLKSAGKEMWIPSRENAARAGNIFQNLSNPAFPEEKKLEVFLGILRENPYNIDYHKYMIGQWGENDQTTAIKNYFGFYDFNDPRMT